MARWQSNLSWGLLLAICAGAFWLGWSPGEAQVGAPGKESPAPETLLPAGAVLYIGCDGLGPHEAEFEKTAAYKAVYDSGLMDAISKLIDAVALKAGGGADLSVLKSVYHTLAQNGASVAVSVEAGQGPPQVYSVVVLSEAAKFEPQLAHFLKQTTRGDVEFKARVISGREVTSGILPNSPGVELGWWTEGKHLLVAVGIDAVAHGVAVAAGDAPNITTNPLWKKYHKDNPPEGMTSLSWLDLGSLRKNFGQMPLPPAGRDAPRNTVNDVLKALGLNHVGGLVSRSGFKGEAMWSESLLENSGPREGLLAYASEKPLSLKDLPPMPADTLGFHACTVEWEKVYDNTVEVVKNVAALGPPDAAAQVDGLLQNLDAILGFDPKQDLFKPLGEVSCVYADGQLGLFGTGVTLAQQVQDEKTFKATLMNLVGRAAEQTTPRELVVKKTAKQGREIITLEIAGGMFNPSFAVADGWLVVGIVPQSVEAFYLRLDGKLDRWAPTQEYQKAFAELPVKYTSLTVTNPQAGVKTLLSLTPILMPMMQAAWQNSPQGRRQGPLPFSVAELPPAELVSKPLFPNVMVQTVDEDGIYCTSRMSLPTLPLLDSGGGAPAVAIGVALLLPAVQQAREAARRSTSKNNLKQIGLALHNYHDTFREFPPGTQPNEKLKPEKRLSWQAKILPFLDQAPLFQNVDFDESWEAKDNEQAVSTRLQVYINPSAPSQPDKVSGPTNYVGIAGVGKDAPTLPKTSKKAGVFGYNRTTRIRDITDGTSNTVMVSEAAKNLGPWAAGGESTIRALTKKPYINGPDGLGGFHQGGCLMLMGDGSVHFISENIDPNTMEALSTIAGGEVIGNF